MAEFPVDPMLAKMIIQSEKLGVTGTRACVCVVVCVCLCGGVCVGVCRWGAWGGEIVYRLRGARVRLGGVAAERGV